MFFFSTLAVTMLAYQGNVVMFPRAFIADFWISTCIIVSLKDLSDKLQESIFDLKPADP